MEEIDVWNKKNNLNMERIGLFKAEILKMFRAFNRPSGADVVEEKAALWEETLKGLKTEKIQEFFLFVRQNEIALPSDGTLRSILSSNAGRFSESTLEDSQYGSYNEKGVYIRNGSFYTWANLPMIRWTENMKSLLEKFHKKTLNSAEAAEWDIVQETRWDALNFEKIYKRVK